MRLHAKIIESALPKTGNKIPSIIIQFVDDKEKQDFEVFCPDFDPYYTKIRKWDIWELSIKWKSEIFTDPKTEVKSYFTHLICTKATPIFQMDKS
ncbi:hypothetical protein [Frigoriflavimonas asaccharolytica]|uniref:Uncharacterized protein n=1 Tax=Frigoriflavimonas asaccharolytica TaxID=2735899 RepID=A0A8J8GAK5_9FLAO|nr:hypothetical protein [Frigoriflavimonas asaccharolytica]NRS92425.1 hypothetical protein [Frigoriflavimonas asaccharolytica]